MLGMRQFITAFAAVLMCLILCLPASAAPKKAKSFQPGKARWDIKTSLPTGASTWAFKYVDLATLLAIKPPPGAKGHSRKMDHARYLAAANASGLVEGDIISTTGWIHLIAAEPDGDYHIQIAESDKSMARCFIVEAPRPAKKFVKDDRVLQATASVRQALLDKALDGKELKYGGTRIITPPVFAKISGQFFYDDWHIGDRPRGKKGCKSPTVAEIHPITYVDFPWSPLIAFRRR